MIPAEGLLRAAASVVVAEQAHPGSLDGHREDASLVAAVQRSLLQVY